MKSKLMVYIYHYNDNKKFSNLKYSNIVKESLKKQGLFAHFLHFKNGYNPVVFYSLVLNRK
jgi:hypothetical protein